MGKDSSIQWTDHTWPVTTGCDDASPGCLNCYSKQASYRMGLNPNPKIAAAYGGTVEKRAGVLRWTGLLRPLPDRLDWPFKWRKPARIFVGNMSDLFHEDVPDEFIDRVFAVMALNPHHTFQVLTKRAERMVEYLTPGYDNRQHEVEAAVRRLSDGERHLRHDEWPLKNVWLGVSVEDQKRADERIPHLLHCPAAVRFLSVEPMLEAIDLSPWLGFQHEDEVGIENVDQSLPREQGIPFHDPWVRGPDWIIVGGESGSHVRPFDLAWARDLRDQCQASGTAYFFKQAGSRPIGSHHERLRMIGEPTSGEDALVRWKLSDSHGGDLSELPPDLRVREFPKEVAHA
jgi:protein gp37